MAKEPPTGSAPQDFTAEEILQLTIDANLAGVNDAQINAYHARNELLLQRRLARVRYENGVTLAARLLCGVASAEAQASAVAALEPVAHSPGEAARATASDDASTSQAR